MLIGTAEPPHSSPSLIHWTVLQYSMVLETVLSPRNYPHSLAMLPQAFNFALAKRIGIFFGEFFSTKTYLISIKA